MLERRGLVVFDEEMADPGEAISQREPEWNEPYIAHEDGRDQTNKAQRAADEVQKATARRPMLSNVIRPEFLEVLDAIFSIHLFMGVISRIA